jgi:hypothetical protein
MADMPEFKDYGALKAFLDKVEEGKAKVKDLPTGTATKSKRKPRKKAEKDPSKKLQHQTPTVPVYKTIHFYVRPGDSWDQVLKDCREEVSYAGPGSMIFAHNHLHSEECSESCREIVVK